MQLHDIFPQLLPVVLGPDVASLKNGYDVLVWTEQHLLERALRSVHDECQKNRSDVPEPLREVRPRTKRNSTWPPPLAGRGRYCFRFESREPCGSRLAGFPEAETDAHASNRVVNGPGRARSVLWSCSPWFR